MQQAVRNDDQADGGKLEAAPALDDAGKPKGLPERTCIVTRKVKPVSELVRFVLSPDGRVTPDLKANLPGRGVWVSATRASVQHAAAQNSFAQGFKTDVKADMALPENLKTLLQERALSALSLANKAGEIICGAVKVAEALENRALALLHAKEGAMDGIEKLNRLFRALNGNNAPVFTFFASKDLDIALGRSNVIHAALKGGSASLAALERLQKLAAYEESREVI